MFVNGVMTEIGVDYCTKHAGIRNEDEHGCDFQPKECEACHGTGVYDGDPDTYDADCDHCDGSGEPTRCHLIPALVPAHPSVGAA